MFDTPQPVVSGRPYQVREVRDRSALGLEDFVGDTTFVLDLDGDAYRVCGPGVSDGEAVRVYEKDEHGLGRDIRVWTIRRGADGVYTAEHLGPVPAPALPAH